jgi:hypothetical protein
MRQRRHTVRNSPNDFPYGTVAHNSPPPLNLGEKSKDEEQAQTNSNNSSDSCHASGSINASLSEIDEFNSLCKKVFPHPQSEMAMMRMKFDYMQYGAKGSNLKEKLEDLRKYDSILSLTKSARTDSQSTKRELSSDPNFYDLPYEIRHGLEEIQTVLKSVPNNTDSFVYDKIKELAERFNDTHDRRVIDDALTYYRGIAANYSRSLLPHQNIVDLSSPNKLGQQESFFDPVLPSSAKPPSEGYYSVGGPYSPHYTPVSYESKSHNHMNDTQFNMSNLAAPSKDSDAQNHTLRHESSIPPTFTSDEIPGPYATKQSLHAEYDSLARHAPTKSNEEADSVVIQTRQDDSQLDTSIESLENLFQKYGLSMIPRSLSEKDPGVIIPDTYTSVPHHVNHTSKTARKKPLHPTPLPKSRVMRSSLTPLQIERGNLDSLEHESAMCERYTASNVADNNSLDDNVINAGTNKEPTLKATDHPNLECVKTGLTSNEALESVARYLSTQNAQTLEGSNQIKTVETSNVDIQQFVDEAILKPVLNNINPEWCLKLFPP